MAGPPTGAVIERTSYTHDAMIDFIISQPWCSQGDIARHFGYSESWISLVIRSDAFREMFAKRKGDMVDPIVLQSIEDQLRGLAKQSLDVLTENLASKRSSDTALKALDVSVRALGFGAKPTVSIHTGNNFVVTMPPKNANGGDWLAEHKPPGPADKPIIDIDTVISG